MRGSKTEAENLKVDVQRVYGKTLLLNTYKKIFRYSKTGECTSHFIIYLKLVVQTEGSIQLPYHV